MRNLSTSSGRERARRCTFAVIVSIVALCGFGTGRSTALSPGPSDPTPPHTAPTSRMSCKDEFAVTKRLLQVSHADLEKALKGSAANRCEALRRHYAVLVATRAVFARCDTGEQRAEHAAQLTASIEKFRKGMPSDCSMQ